MLIKLNNLKLNQINLSSSTKKIIFLVPPLLLASYYVGKRIYLYWKLEKKKDKESLFYETFDHSRLTSTSNSISLNQSLEVVDGSLDPKTDRSKCSYCRSKQKLSFRDPDVLDSSLKNLSATQIIKYCLDNLNNVNKSLGSIKAKQNILKDNNVDSSKMIIIDEKIQSILERLESLNADLETFRNEQMAISNSIDMFENDDDDFDDQASYISSATTASLGYWDPEPNLSFFQLYQDSLSNVDFIKPPKADRTIITGSENYNDFLAKVHCLRQAFNLLFTKVELRNRFAKIGEEILRIILDHSLRDSNECIKAYYVFLDFVQNNNNLNKIEVELEPRKIAMLSFYDIVLDYMILESFDDLENPPLPVKTIISNQWLSSRFREIALQTTVSAVMRRKRTKLVVKDGFFEHFYCILDHLSPVLAWGFLGTNENLKFKCESVKDSTCAVIRDYFSFDRCRYTYLEDLCEDIRRVTEERFWELNNKLKIINSSQ